MITKYCRSAIKMLLPPIFIRIFRAIVQNRSTYSGNYASLEAARAVSTGYDSELILDRVTESLLRVKLGQAVYERDSVLFTRIQYSFPLLVGLLRAAAENENRLIVLDFGGSLGSTYFQCREVLSVISKLSWCIVEQDRFVDRGKQKFQSNDLKFYFSIEECARLNRPNVILLSGVLQYLDRPGELLETMMNTGVQYIIIDRTPFADLDNDRLCVQKVPPEVYPGSYPCWIFSESRMKERLSKEYDLILDFDGNDGHAEVKGLSFQFKGMIWRRLNNA